MSRRAHRAQHKRAPRVSRGPVATTLGITGELLLTLGVLVLLYVVYVLWGTGIQTDRAQGELREQTVERWSNPLTTGETSVDPAEIDIGEGYALLRIPALGDDWNGWWSRASR